MKKLGRRKISPIISPKLTPVSLAIGGGKRVVAANTMTITAGTMTSAIIPCHGSAVERKKPASPPTIRPPGHQAWRTLSRWVLSSG